MNSIERFYQFMKMRQMNQVDVAKDLGITQAGVSRLLKKPELTAKDRIVFSRLYNLSPSWLEKGSEPMFMPHENQYEDTRQSTINDVFERVSELRKARLYETALTLQREQQADDRRKASRENQLPRRSGEFRFHQEDIIESVMVPVSAVIAAGSPRIVFSDSPQEEFPAPVTSKERDKYFWIKVSGDSMIDCGIEDGDLVLIERRQDVPNNKVCVVKVDDEFTLKIFRFQDRTNTVTLTPCNPSYPITTHKANTVEVLGVRKYVLKV